MSKQLKADLFLLLITAIWGSSFTLMKNVLDHIPSFAYLTLRFLIATVALIIIFGKYLKNVTKKALLFGSIIGLLLFLGMALQVTGLYYTSASNSAFITGFNVIMVPVISSIILKKKPDRASVIGVITAFAGLFFLSCGLNFNFNKGDFLTLLCALCFALQIIFIDKFTNEYDPVLLSIIQIAAAAILNGFVWGIEGKGIAFSFDKTVVLTLLVTGLFGTALAFAGQTAVQRFTTPTRTALILTAEPVFGAFFATVIPGTNGLTETLKWNTILGCILILAGMLVSEFKLGNKKAANI
jgi:drug/metabolite transporter (DMT)-like permease